MRNCMSRNGFPERELNNHPADTEVGPPADPPPRHDICAKAGFTLIEMLVAVTVLVVITLLLARIISQSTQVMTDGARQAAQNANARLALDFLAREFAQSGGDSNLPFQRKTGVLTTYGAFPCDDLRFATFNRILTNGVSQDREAVQVGYYVKDLGSSGYYSLYRAEKTINPSGYGTSLRADFGAANEAELIRYVVEFRVVCYDTNATATVMDSAEKKYLPVYADVYLAVLSEGDARRAHQLQLTGGDFQAYVHRTAKRYHTRCWSLNRIAYIRGR